MEGKIKAMAISPSGHVLAICTDRSVQVFLRASQLEALAWHQEETAWRNSFFGRITQLIQRIMRRPLPALPTAPPLPAAVARAALNTQPEVREIERFTSQALVNAYRQVAAAARQVDWQSVGRSVETGHRRSEGGGRLDAAVADLGLVGLGPSVIADAGSGKVDHGVDVTDAGEVDDACRGVPGGLVGRGRRPSNKTDDFMPAGAQVGDKG